MNKILIGIMLMLSLGLKAQVIDTTQITTNRPIQGTIIDTNAIAGDTNLMEFTNSEVNVPSISSPTVSGLGEYSKFPVGLNTGIPQINIPLVTLKGKELSVPVSISYHAGGTRVDDMASWVGLGWSLNAGGVITRVVKGMPDDMVSFSSNTIINSQYKRVNVKSYFDNCRYLKSGVVGSLWDLNFVPDSSIVLPRLLMQKSGSYLKVRDSVIVFYDKEPDYFYFNFCGKTGKFVFAWDETTNSIKPYCFPQNELQIDYTPDMNKFVITDENGTKYIFGTNSKGEKIIETTLSDDNTTKFYLQKNKFIKSAWFLTEIISSDESDIIKFNYVGLTELLDEKVSETKSLIFKYNELPFKFHKTTTNTLVNTFYLQDISSSTNKVYIVIGNDRLDIRTSSQYLEAKTARLKEIHFYDYTRDTICLNRIKLHQSYFKTNKNYTVADAHLHHRLKLDSISIYDGNYNLKQPSNVFKYFDTIVPVRGSCYRDLEGFDNQKVVNEQIITLVPDKINKNKDEKAPLAGLLNTIISPIGSKTFYDYETGQKYPRIYGDSVIIESEYRVSGGGTTPSKDEPDFVYRTFRVLNECKDIWEYVDNNVRYCENRSIVLYAKIEFSQLYGYDVNKECSVTRCFICPLCTPGSQYIEYPSITPANSNVEYSTWVQDIWRTNLKLKIYKNHKIKITVYIKTKTTDYNSNIPRLKAIYEINPTKKDTIFTSYEYNIDNKSSHVNLKKYLFATEKQVRFYNNTHVNNYYESIFDSILTVTSNNMSEAAINESPVMFKQVTEKYGKNGALGKSVYNFIVEPDEEKYSNQFNEEWLNPNTTQPVYILKDKSYKRGLMEKQTMYDGEGKILKTIEYNYETFYDNHTKVKAIPVIRSYPNEIYTLKVCPVLHTNIENYWHTTTCGNDVADSTFIIYGKMTKYYLYTSFSRISKITTKEYDKLGGVKKTEVEYKYDNNLHNNTTRVITNVNDEYTIIERNKYLKDYDLTKLDNEVLKNLNTVFKTINPLIENQVWQKEDGQIKLMSASISRFTIRNSPKYYQYRVDGSYSYQPLKPLTASELGENPEDGNINYSRTFYNNAFVLDMTYEYDADGFLKTIRPKDETPKSFLWDKKIYGLKAKVENAVFRDAPIGNSATILDAESGNKKTEENDYWNLSQQITISQSEKHSGRYSIFSGNNANNYDVNKYIRPENMNKKFIFSAWIKVVSAGKQMGFDVKKTNVADPIEWQSINLEPTNGQWKYVQMIIDMPAIMKKKNVTAAEIDKIGLFFTYGGEVYIDDVRFIPIDAQITTATQIQGIGTESVTGTDNRTTFYEYDSFGRLKSVKDQDKRLKVNYFYNIKR